MTKSIMIEFKKDNIARWSSGGYFDKSCHALFYKNNILYQSMICSLSALNNHIGAFYEEN